jgi:hypothetical protein
MSSAYKKRKTWKDAKAHIAKTHRGFLDLIEKRIEELAPADEDRMRFLGLLGQAPMEGPLRLSDLTAHFHLAINLAKEVRHLRQVSDDLDFYHLTLLADEGVMSDRTPSFALRLLKGKANRAMRTAGLEGFYVVEVQPLMNWPQGGEGRTLLGHVHVLGWKKRDAPNNSAGEIRSELGFNRRRRNTAWSSMFGAAPIEVVALTEALGCPEYWVAYLLKMPHVAKNRIKRMEEGLSSGNAKYKLRPTVKGYRPELAMRMFELFGQLPLFATMGAVGAGDAMLSRCKNKVLLWDEERRAEWDRQGREPIPAFDERKFWKRTHKRRRARYRSFFVDGPTIGRRTSRKWK